MSNLSPDHILNTAHDMADAARAVILPYFRRHDLVADNKLSSDLTSVTEADRAAEKAMREILANAQPEDGILRSLVKLRAKADTVGCWTRLMVRAGLSVEHQHGVF